MIGNFINAILNFLILSLIHIWPASPSSASPAAIMDSNASPPEVGHQAGQPDGKGEEGQCKAENGQQNGGPLSRPAGCAPAYQCQRPQADEAGDGEEGSQIAQHGAGEVEISG